MSKTGPKPKYADWMPECILEVASIPGQYKSAMLWEIGKRLGSKRPISPDTFARWCEEYSEFGNAWKDSKIISQAIDEKRLHDVATGVSKGNVGALSMLFSVKYKDEYKPVDENRGNTTINNLTIENLSVDELQYRIARSQEVLQQAGKLIEINPRVESIEQ